MSRDETDCKTRRLPVLPPERPNVRGDCAEIPRPCPFASCRHHLAADSRDGAPYLYSCALDAAEDGAHTLEEVGQILGMAPELVREIEVTALARLRGALRSTVQATHQAA